MEASGSHAGAPPRFGDVLRSLREATGLSQEELAHRASLSTDAISALERGTRTRPYPATVRALADAMSLTPEQRAALIALVPQRQPRDAPASSDVPDRPSLPTLPGALLGREQDLRDVTELLHGADHRLVTLTGPGGVGKTRLALAVAHAWDERGDVRFVPLAGVRHPGLVMAEVARALEPGAAGTTEVRTRLAAMDGLLVLDNLEHLLEAAPTIAEVLASSPTVSVLATSRTPLRIRGEVEHEVRPLAPPPRGSRDVAEVLASPAAALVMSRGRALRRDLVLTPAQAPAVAEICHRLSGLPLALELAAAGLRTLDPRTLLAHLDEVLASPGAADLPARQLTLRATLDWSYDLLPSQLRPAFRRLSVFVGGFTLEAAQVLLDDAGAHRSVDDLATHSLCSVRTGSDGGPRYQILDVVARYGRSRMTAEEADATYRTHARYFLSLAESALSGTHGNEQLRWLRRLDEEASNLVAGYEWAVSEGDGELAGRFTWALWMFWWMRGHASWARELISRTLAMDMSDSTRARVLVAWGGLTAADGDTAGVERRYAEAAQLARRSGDREAEASATLALGTIALERKEFLAAEDRLAQATLAAQDAGPDGAWYDGHAQVLLGAARRFRGDLDGAVEAVSAGLAAARARHDTVATTIALYNLGQAFLALGDTRRARRHLVEAAMLCAETADAVDLSYVVRALASLSTDNPEAAARFFGAADAMRDDTGAAGYAFYALDETTASATADRVRTALGEAPYQREYQAGRDLALAEVIGLAQSLEPNHIAPQP